mmetsp:Transcript_21344/g.29363  ORF Transcript_21344/g.29363 Transcript_21344/m.29363 type:complete len:305 (+) Transcript_21344:13-927(+)
MRTTVLLVWICQAIQIAATYDSLSYTDIFYHSKSLKENEIEGSVAFNFDRIGASKNPTEFNTKLDLSNLQYHGTTTVAFKNKESVIVCIDSKASIGKYIGSRTVKKVFPISSHIVATMAGGAADCAYWIRSISTFAKIFEYKYGIKAMKVSAVAKVLANKLAEFKGAGLSVGTMIAGFDITTKSPSLYYVDSEGTYVGGDIFCVGSGATLAYSILDSTSSCSESGDTEELDLHNMPQDQAIDAAVAAVQCAARRDGYSGGYINVIVVDQTGCHHVRRAQATHTKTIPYNSKKLSTIQNKDISYL